MPARPYISAMKTLVLFLSVLLCSVRAVPQSTVAGGDRDSTHGERIVLVEPGMAPGNLIFLIPPHLERQLLFESPTFFFAGIPSLSSAPVYERPFEVHPDLLAPLRLQWEREAQLGTFRKILGSIQLGGVAYLAYRHFSKSGTMTIRPRAPKSNKK